MTGYLKSTDIDHMYILADNAPPDPGNSSVGRALAYGLEGSSLGATNSAYE